jgi:hypothetical protein
MSSKSKISATHILCALFILLGVTAYTAQVIIDIVSALKHTTDQTGRYLQPLLLIAMAGMTFSLGAFAGLRFRAGTPKDIVIGCVCFLLATYFLFYSFSNSVGFSFEQTVGKMRLVEAQNQQAKDLVEEQKKQARDMLAGILDFAKRTYVTAQGKADKADAKGLLKDMLKESATPTPILTPKVEEVMPDGKAEAFGGWLGLNPEQFRLLDSVYLAFGICLIKWLAPALGFGYWPAARRQAEVVDSETKPQATAPALPPCASLDDHTVDDLQSVKEWLELAMHYNPNGTDEIQATDALHHFNEWEKQKDPTRRLMTLTKFGDCTTELGIKKKRGRVVIYIGLRPREAAVAPPRTSTRGRRARKMQHAPA